MNEIRLPNGHGLAVAREDGWTALFQRRTGWTGADGIYAIPLSGADAPGAAARTPTLFVFSDTFIGEVDDRGARVRPVMVHNTVAVLDGAEPDPARIRFRWGLSAVGRPGSLFVPRTPRGLAVPDSYYWLQDGAVVGGHWHLFPMIVGPNPGGPEGFRFRVHGVARISGPVGRAPSEDVAAWGASRQWDVPLHYRDAAGRRVTFGAAIHANTRDAGSPSPDGFVYVYGLRHVAGGVPRQLVAARVPEPAFADEGLAAWRFWDGAAWSADPAELQAVAPAVSSECSVSRLVGGWWDGRYALACQLGDAVSLYLGDTPVGPFRDPIALYRCPEVAPATRAEGVYVYNAKAHPHLAGAGDLLLSYNVNTTSWPVHLRRADIYRPRFVRVRALP